MQTKTILARINRLAKLSHRDINGQLLAMTELYEKTYGISGKVQRKPKKTKQKAKPEVKAAPKPRKRRSDIGKRRSEQARENMRMGQLKAKARKLAAEALGVAMH